MRSVASAILLAFVANGQPPANHQPPAYPVPMAVNAVPPPPPAGGGAATPSNNNNPATTTTTATTPAVTTPSNPSSGASPSSPSGPSGPSGGGQGSQGGGQGGQQQPGTPPPLPPIIPLDPGSFSCPGGYCAGRTVDIFPSQGWSFDCANCAGMTMNIYVGDDPANAGFMVDRLGEIKFNGPNAGRGAVINVINTKCGMSNNFVEVNDIRCESPGACNGLVINAGPCVDIWTANCDCQLPGSCMGAIIRDAVKMEACDPNQNVHVNGGLAMPWQIPNVPSFGLGPQQSPHHQFPFQQQPPQQMPYQQMPYQQQPQQSPYQQMPYQQPQQWPYPQQQPQQLPYQQLPYQPQFPSNSYPSQQSPYQAQQQLPGQGAVNPPQGAVNPYQQQMNFHQSFPFRNQFPPQLYPQFYV